MVDAEAVARCHAAGVGRGSAGRGVNLFLDPHEHLLTSFHTIIRVRFGGHLPSSPSFYPLDPWTRRTPGVGSTLDTSWTLGGKVDYLNAPLTVSAGEAVVLAVAEPRTHETRHMVIPRVALIGIGPTVRIGI
jgi:hypothetical protein